MIARAVSSRLDLSGQRLSLLTLFVAMAILLYAGNAIARTVAEGLFLANAGAKAVPLYLIIVGLTAVPVAAAMSRFIAKVSKVRLFQVSLLLAGAAAVVLRLLVVTGAMPVWFAVLIGIVLMEMLLNLQFWLLIADFFTTLEQKRIISLLTIVLAVGGTMGGGAASLLARAFDISDLLLMFPIPYLLVFVLARRLGREPAMDVEDEGGEESLAASLKSLPRLLRQYPLITLMAVVGFLDVLMGGVGSYLAYTVYIENFPDEQRLTQFLGTLRAAFCVFEVLLVLLVTQPLIAKMGVGRMNVLYPLTSLISLIGLGFRPSVPTAVIASLNFDSTSASLNTPVENLTYNAVPPRFLGQVRAISEGMLQPAGLAGGGLLLAAVQQSMSFQQIAFLAIALSCVHVALGWWRGRAYFAALSRQLSSRSVDLTAADGVRTKVPAAYAEEVSRLLSSEDAEARSLGVELAARVGTHRFLPEVLPVLPSLDGAGRVAAVDYLSALLRLGKEPDVLELLEDGGDRVRVMAVEALMAAQRKIPEPRLRQLVESSDLELRSLALFAANPEQALAEMDSDWGAPKEAKRTVARVLGSARDARYVPILARLMTDDSVEVRGAAIQGLAVLAPLPAPHRAVVEAARDQLDSEDATIRRAVYELLAAEGEAHLARLAQGLEDPHAMVRSRVGELLAGLGDPAIPFVAGELHSPRPEVAESALSALGGIRTPAASETALQYLQADYARVEENLAWIDRLPGPEDERWRPLQIALEDSNTRAVEKVLRVLDAFGHSKILFHARMALRARDRRFRANAVEALASISHRQFVLPVVRVLEALAGEGAERQADGGIVEFTELFESEDRWIRAAAGWVARELDHVVPESLLRDPDKVVRAVVGGSSDTKNSEEPLMSRLLFLKSVSLFNGLSLDQLLALDDAMRQEDFLEGETIFEEGSLGEDFYLLISGEVSVQTGEDSSRREVARLGPGNFFGEMALFDDEPRSATCVAATACVLLALDRHRFHSLLEQLPRLGLAINRELSQRVRHADRALAEATREQAS